MVKGNVELVEDFCYLGNYLSRTGGSDKELFYKTCYYYIF